MQIIVSNFVLMGLGVFRARPKLFGTRLAVSAARVMCCFHINCDFQQSNCQQTVAVDNNKHNDRPTHEILKFLFPFVSEARVIGNFFGIS